MEAGGSSGAQACHSTWRGGERGSPPRPQAEVIIIPGASLTPCRDPPAPTLSLGPCLLLPAQLSLLVGGPQAWWGAGLGGRLGVPTWEPLPWRQAWRERGFTPCSRGNSAFPSIKQEKCQQPPWKPHAESRWSSELCPCRSSLPDLSPPSSHFTCPPHQLCIHWCFSLSSQWMADQIQLACL